MYTNCKLNFKSWFLTNVFFFCLLSSLSPIITVFNALTKQFVKLKKNIYKQQITLPDFSYKHWKICSLLISELSRCLAHGHKIGRALWRNTNSKWSPSWNCLGHYSPALPSALPAECRLSSVQLSERWRQGLPPGWCCNIHNKFDFTYTVKIKK